MKKLLTIISFLIVLILPISSISSSNINESISYCLRNLDLTKYKGEEFDYWPDGGIRNTYNHLSTFITYQDLAKASGKQVFKSGPHTNDQLVFDSQYSFGNYNPQFVLWAKDKIKNIVSNKELVQETKPLIETYLSKVLLTYYETYLELQKNRAWLDSETDEYRTLIDSKNLPEDYYYKYAWVGSGYSQYPVEESKFLIDLNKKYNPNVVSPAISFWMRRTIDGTAGYFFDNLRIFLEAYGLSV